MNILIAGDFVPSFRVAEQIENGDYSCLNEIKTIIQSVDYSIVNFESPIVIRDAKPINKTGPNLKCSEKAMECLVEAGFKCVTLANNHFRDFGQIGVEDTLNSCKKYGMDYVGGGVNIDEAQQICYKEIHDQKLAIINICEKEWSIANSSFGGSAPLNPISNYYSIKRAKEIADYVIVIVHGGIEHYQFPTPRMVETYRFFVDAGADVVINHHQHCYSGYEVYKNKPIFYGLGNFCFDKNGVQNSAWNIGYMVKLNLTQSLFEIIPFNQCSSTSTVKLMVDEERNKIDQDLNQINTIITNSKKLDCVFENYIKTIQPIRKIALEPIYNKFLLKLRSKKLFPSFFKGRTMMDWCDRLNCESHRELLGKMLLDEIEGN